MRLGYSRYTPLYLGLVASLVGGKEGKGGGGGVNLTLFLRI